MPCRRLFVGLLLMLAQPAAAQQISQRGFVEGRALLFAQRAPNDPTRFVGDLLIRHEVFVKPAPWIRFAGGLELRANTHDQVQDDWTVDVADRGVRRPRLSIRRLTYNDFQLVQGIWTARQMEMADLRRDSRTRLTLDKLQYNVPLKDEDFTLQAIRRQ